MPEVLTESFCERCGTRYTFESAVPRTARLKSIKVLGRGLKNFVMSDDTSIDEAMAAARSETDRDVTSQQLDAFHKTFSFCMSCRQYTCHNCWNEVEGKCLTCAPHLGHEILQAPFPAISASTGLVPPATGTNGHATLDVPQTDDGWPAMDFGSAAIEAEADESTDAIEPIEPIDLAARLEALALGPSVTQETPAVAEPGDRAGSDEAQQLAQAVADATAAEVEAAVLAEERALAEATAIAGPDEASTSVAAAGPVDDHAESAPAGTDAGVPGSWLETEEPREVIPLGAPGPYGRVDETPVPVAIEDLETIHARDAVDDGQETAGPVPDAAAVAEAAQEPVESVAAYDRSDADPAPPVVALDPPDADSDLPGAAAPEPVGPDTAESVTATMEAGAEAPAGPSHSPQPRTVDERAAAAASNTAGFLSRFRPGQSLDEALEAFERDQATTPVVAEPVAATETESVVAAEVEAQFLAADVQAEPVATAEAVVEVEAEPVVAAEVQAEPALAAGVPAEADVEAEAEPLRATEAEAAHAKAHVEAGPAAAEPAPEPVLAPEAEAEIEPGPAFAAKLEVEPQPAPAATAGTEEVASPAADIVAQPTWRIVAPDPSPADASRVPSAAGSEPAQPSASAAPRWPAQPQWPSRSTDAAGLPFLDRPAAPTGGIDALWAESSRGAAPGRPPTSGPAPLAGPQPVQVAVQPCVNCGLSLSATARFCRRCGTPQKG
jgi:hypothetical protein